MITDRLFDTPEAQAFREEVRAFLSSGLPPELNRYNRGGRSFDPHELQRWQGILNQRGWGAPSWPLANGGTGWGALQRQVFDEECAAAGAPHQVPFGLNMIGPVIARFGTPEQRERFLPRIKAGLDWWCQGFSEPGSGSDLASLRTRARLENGVYVVNGQKTWTSFAQHANWMFCLVRTADGGKPQQGISMLLIDMATPGITVRPIITLDGEHEVNEVWFDQVSVPATLRVGEENMGWTYAKFLLGHERLGVAAVGRHKASLRQLRRLMSRHLDDQARPLVENPRWRDRLVEAQTDLMALEAVAVRLARAADDGRPTGVEASMLKIKGSELQQMLAALQAQALGAYGQPRIASSHADAWLHEADVPHLKAEDLAMTGLAFNSRKVSIYGGSNEIQLNILAQSLFE